MTDQENDPLGVPEPIGSAPITRRRMLSLAGAGLGAAALGASGLITARPAGALTLASHSEIWGQRTYYEIGGAATSFSYDPAFYTQLETWLAFWYGHTPNTWLTPLRVYSYGAYVNKPGAHGLGRGFDLSQLWVTSGGSATRTFWGRYDLWQSTTGNELTFWRRHYWGTSASLHYHFRNVLTYPYNADHHNHIHVDNLVSGSGLSTFDTTSQAQVQHVQACCTYIWGYATTIDGAWGPQTSGNASRVLARVGSSGSLTSSTANWRTFNLTSTEYGTGRTAF